MFRTARPSLTGPVSTASCAARPPKDSPSSSCRALGPAPGRWSHRHRAACCRTAVVWLGKQTARGVRQVGAPLGQPELTLVVPPQAQGDQQVMQHLEGWEFVFVDYLVVAEHFFRAFPRPVEMLDRPMDEDALECLVLVSPIDPCSCAYCRVRRAPRSIGECARSGWSPGSGRNSIMAQHCHRLCPVSMHSRRLPHLLTIMRRIAAVFSA